MIIPRWKYIRSAVKARWKRNTVVSCYIGKTYFVLRQRSAYNWSWSSNYFNESAFHLTLDDAKNWIERKREQGSSWTIEEWPSLVILGQDYAVCMANANRMEQFEGCPDVYLRRKTLKMIAADLQIAAPNETYFFLTRPDLVEPISKPLCRFSSSTWRGSYDLSWRVVGQTSIKLTDIFDLQKKIWKLIDSRLLF